MFTHSTLSHLTIPAVMPGEARGQATERQTLKLLRAVGVMAASRRPLSSLTRSASHTTHLNSLACCAPPATSRYAHSICAAGIRMVAAI